MKVTCPHCGKKHALEYLAHIPDEQKMSITVTSESEAIAADTLGSLLTNTTKALQGVAKNIGGKVGVFVSDVKVHKNKVKIDIFIASVKSKSKSHSGS